VFVVVDVVVGFIVVADSVVAVVVVDAVVVLVVVVVVIADGVVVGVVVVMFARFSFGDWFGLARSTLGGRFGVDEMKVGPSCVKNWYNWFINQLVHLQRVVKVKVEVEVEVLGLPLK